MFSPMNRLNLFWSKVIKLLWRLGSPIALLALRDESQITTFTGISKQYADLFSQLDPDGNMSARFAAGEGLYLWRDHIATLKAAFSRNVPICFLRNPIISWQMVAETSPGITREKIAFIESVWPADRVSAILREDYIGLPKLVNFKYCTSGNRIHHAFHLVSYKYEIKKEFADSDNIVEWGGGYGDMAHLIRRLNPGCTYTIIDLPEISALQYVYLYSLLGDEVHLVTPKQTEVKKGKVNIVPVGRVLDEEITLSANAFLSTWAITESSQDAQEFVCNKSFFGAEAVLLAYHDDSQSYVKNHLPKPDFISLSVPFLPADNIYAFL